MPTQIRNVKIISNKLKERILRHNIDFVPGVNLLIGPNGSGKSSLLSQIKKSERRSEGDVVIKADAGVFMAFDFEKDNTRTKHPNLLPSSMYEVGIVTRFISHGETVKMVLENLTSEDAVGKMLLLDEPEQALDVDGLLTLVDQLRNTTANQVIVATHSPTLILQPEFNVIELVEGYRQKIRDHVASLIK